MASSGAGRAKTTDQATGVGPRARAELGDLPSDRRRAAPRGGTALDFSRRMHERLGQEPTVIAPHMRLSHRAVRYTLPLAAGGRRCGAGGLAGAVVAAGGAAAGDRHGTTSASPAAPCRTPVPSCRHVAPSTTIYSRTRSSRPSTAMQGVASYVRTVSAGRVQRTMTRLALRLLPALVLLQLWVGARAGRPLEQDRSAGVAAEDRQCRAPAQLHRHLRLPARRPGRRPPASPISPTRPVNTRSWKRWTAPGARSSATTTRS